MRYRVDFSRLSRDIDEIIRTKQVTEILTEVFGEFGGEKITKQFKDFNNSLPEGHILDTMFVEDNVGLNGLEILERKVRPIYPEAKLFSYDEIRE